MPENTHTRFDSEGKAAQDSTNLSHLPLKNSKKRKRHEVVPSDKANDASRGPSVRQTGTPIPTGTSSAAQIRTYILTPSASDLKPKTPDNAPSKHHHDPTASDSQLRLKNGQLQNGTGHKRNAQDLIARAQALWPKRKALPVWTHADTIRGALQEKDILLLVGETGSGKSTQVPQMLIKQPWFKDPVPQDNRGSRIGGCIAVTEPRRVAAITLAQRVAQEVGTTLGGSKGKVGYSVRFDTCAGPETRIKYLTEGMLLQEMLQDPWLRKYSAVVVDEVHERGTNVDIVLGFLKRMIVDKEGLKERRGQPLKVCVMSATAEVERIVEFFSEAKISAMTNGFHEKESMEELEERTAKQEADDESEWEGIQSSEDEQEPCAVKDRPAISNSTSVKESVNGTATNSEPRPIRNGELKANGVIKETVSSTTLSTNETPANLEVCYIEGRQYPVSINYAASPITDLMDGYLRAVFQIHHSEPMPGDMLVFVTGQEVVERLEQLVREYASSLPKDIPGMLVLPLFAALPQAAQQRVFEPAPKGMRKVILATNIAETSVTISGVRFVIDCGMAKIKHFRTRIGLESLLVKPISKSSAIQRKGRAGREAPGKCFRLYTESFYLDLERSNTPELLRSDLSHAILVLKARGITDIFSFPFLSPPSHASIAKALLMLYELGALSESGSITKIGRRMAYLPLSAPLSRTLLAASDSVLDCLDEAIDIVACLSVENIFLTTSSLSDEQRDAATAARADILRREGDHLTLLACIRAYAAEQSDRKSWCEARLISHRALRSVMDTRKQLRAHFHLPAPAPDNSDTTTTATIVSTDLAERILMAFLTGFKMNTARLMPDGSYRTLVAGSQVVAIHPSSVLAGRKVECIMYNEFVFTQKAWARGVSAIQMNWIGKVFEPSRNGAESLSEEDHSADAKTRMNGYGDREYEEPDDVVENNSR